MNANTKRLLIALKSPLQQAADPRPRCEECGIVLARRDFLSFWDGQGAALNYAAPRCCENCAEKMECKSV
jgi:hypothetical protein